MIAYLIDIEFCWGFQSKIVGLSKTSPSFYYPPPTTILGSIAEVIAKQNSIGENKGRDIIPIISRNLLALGIRPLNFVPIKYEDINKIIAIKRTRGKPYPDPKDLKSSFDSPAIGKTIFSSLNDEAPTLRIFIVLKNDELRLDNKILKLKEDVFWKIHRLGTKESIVTVIDVKSSKPSIKRETVITNYSFPLLDGIEIKRKSEEWIYENYLNPFNLDKYDPLSYHTNNTIIYVVPIRSMIISESKSIVRLNKNNAYVVGDEIVIGL